MKPKTAAGLAGAIVLLFSIICQLIFNVSSPETVANALLTVILFLFGLFTPAPPKQDE